MVCCGLGYCCLIKMFVCRVAKTILQKPFHFLYFPTSFHHFPHFRVQNGEPGDSLIWDPRRNELLIADRDAQHEVLCFWKKHKKGTVLQNFKIISLLRRVNTSRLRMRFPHCVTFLQKLHWLAQIKVAMR